MTVGTPTLSSLTTFSHTVGASQRSLWVILQARLSTGSPGITSVEYGGVAMTSAFVFNADQITNAIYYLIDPTAGAADVVVTYASAPDGQLHTAVDIDGDIDADPVGFTRGNNATGDEDLSITPEATSGIFLSSIIGTNGTFTASTITALQTDTNISSVFSGANGYRTHAGSAADVNWTWDGDAGPYHVIVEIVPTRPAAPYNPLALGTATTSTSASFSHTVAAGTQMLIVGVQARRGAGAPDATAITFGGVALTKGIEGAADQTASDMWYLLNPTAGSGTVAITWDNAPDGQRNWAVDLTGGPDLNDPIGATFSNSALGDNTETITPEARTGLLLSNILSDASSAHTIDQSQQTWSIDGRMIEIASGVQINDVFYGIAGYREHYGSNAVVSWSGDSTPTPHTIMEIKQHPGRKWGIALL